ncbi:hypothetical protein BSKO_02908 [Bryopsis sp. KO-2023]|nr:hypothetical protein BSKO_02908 [Bryopsis sp. KO-2023]
MNWLIQQYRKPSLLVIHVSFITASWLFSGMHVFSRPALEHLPPYVFSVIRLMIGLPFMYLITLKEKRVDLTWGDNGRLIMIGISGIGIAQSVIFAANKLMGAGIVGMMLPLSTIITMLLSGILGLERIGPLKVIGAFLAVSGSIAIAWVTEKDFHADTVWGVVFMFLQTTGWSTYLIVMSQLLKSKPIPTYAYFRAAVWGLLFMLPLGAMQISDVKWSEIPYWVWLVEIYCGLVVSSGVHVAMSWLIKHCAALMPAMYTSIQPLTTVILASLVLGERFSVWLFLCMFSILAGLILVIIAKAKEQQQATPACEKDVSSGNEDAREPLIPAHAPTSDDEGIDKAKSDTFV